MATIQTLEDGDFFANRVAFLPPVLDGLECWFYLNQDAVDGTVVQNLAPGKPDGVLVGTPGLIAASHLRLGAGSYIETGVPAVGDATLITVLRVPDGTALGSGVNACYGLTAYRDGAVASYQTIRQPIGGEAFPAGVPYSATSFDVAGVATFAQAIGAIVSDVRNWLCIQSRVEGEVGLKTSNLTASTETTTANANDVFDFPSNTYRIGAASTTNGLAVDAAISVLISRAVTIEESVLIHQALAEYMDILYSASI